MFRFERFMRRKEKGMFAYFFFFFFFFCDKVKNPQAVGFDPKFLLRTLCVIFVNFGSRSEFRNAIIRGLFSF